MAIPTSTFVTYQAKGNREDLVDDIYLIDPIDTPVMSLAERSTATAVLHEWQSQALAAAAANSNLEGDDASTNAATASVRLSNSSQISDKVPRVSGTQQAVKHAGRSDEMAYQVALKSQELKRDMEFIICANTAENAGDTSTARTLGSLGAWIETNVSAGVGGSGSNLAGNTARTDGTQRVFTETLLKDVLQLQWDNGGKANYMTTGSFNKRQFSGFTGNATRMIDATGAKLQAGIDVYSSDWGTFKVIPNRFQRTRDVWVFQSDMIAIAYLRPFLLKELAKTGDSERKQLLVEYTLEVRNQKAHGLVADLTTS